jgi:hypothetical protein
MLTKFNSFKATITPTTIIPKTYNYFTGIIYTDLTTGISDNIDFPSDKAISGSALEEYFPVVNSALNLRGNWNAVNWQQAIALTKSYYLNFSWTNSIKISGKSIIHPRFLLTSLENYISNKNEFYKKFQNYDFIPKYQSFNINNIQDINNISAKCIIKPDIGRAAKGIKILDTTTNFTQIIKQHINQYPEYKDWTISEFIQPRLYNNHIICHRVYFLVVKINNTLVKSYYYKRFVNNIALKEFQGDISDKEQSLSNYIDDVNYTKNLKYFYKNRHIKQEDWENTFTSQQLATIHASITKALYIITDNLASNIIASNDYINESTANISDTQNKISYHLYGADIIIDEKLNIKILELNGCPSLNMYPQYYNITDKINYIDILDELFQKTIDLIYKPLNKTETKSNFIQIYSKMIDSTRKQLYYIPNSIVEKYPFIYYALNKRPWLKRTKNMYDNITFFYGKRERYITPETSLKYYDELINYLTSKRMRNAEIVNKVQGITYHLANKGNLYKSLSQSDFHPPSVTIKYNNNIKEQVADFIIDNRFKKLILKPIYGSKGVGIKIFDSPSSILSFFKFKVDDVVKAIKDHIESYLLESTHSIYREWILCQYIDNPDLIKFGSDRIGRKYNIRFYVVIKLNDLELYGRNGALEEYEVFLYNDFLIYFAMLEYVKKQSITGLSPDLINNMINLTNLEIVNQVIEITGVNIDKSKYVTMLSMLKKGQKIRNNIIDQVHNIIKTTINNVAGNLRVINRHAHSKPKAYNMLAYDSLLDDNGKLYLIEVNRGPDMNGLLSSNGLNKCTAIFDELFSLVLDEKPDMKKLVYWNKVSLGSD